jgi:hypothetical protein
MRSSVLTQINTLAPLPCVNAENHSEEIDDVHLRQG